ncbi:MAG: hypothetical protein GTN86_00760 [Xanthomonadales bacterium]|nr:hypothetical protein [Xanthomonadales bacterium]NIN58348.1 hypothetical protein [Xanthomonadales bacterium]NIN73685.1 hypothetical protein [Xanthomonadales bacterium]NIO14480.1 hypothetical protein [Xanthomonadales bacterium]NIP10741.1 hypothetical protein [Xanthomonadales bacterium]
MSWQTGGFTECGLSVRAIEPWSRLLTEVGGWEVVHRGLTPASTRRLWPIPADTPVEECLLGNPGDTTGYLRLFRFQLPDQREIRGGAQAWDSGGIYDLDVRVPALEPFHAALAGRGWRGVSAPVEWSFGELCIREWLAVGPEATVLALIERVAPPLEGWPTLRKFSRIFNSSQTVADMDRAVAFYRRLGFTVAVSHDGPLAGRGGEVLGLAPERAPRTRVELVIMHPQGVMDGSIELVRIHDMPARDFSADALPHQLGLNLVRFPVQDIGAFSEHVRRTPELPDPGPIVRTRLEPFGPVELLALRSPDGAWLEFYEAARDT